MASGKECDLCGLGYGRYPVQQHIGDADRFFCCLGCMNVYAILWESGSIRAGQDIRRTELFQRSLKLGLISNRSSDDEKRSIEDSRMFTSDAPPEELLLHIGGMWCTSCAWLIEHALTALPGIVEAEVSFASDLVKVQYHPQALSRECIVERITGLGYNASERIAGEDDADRESRDLLIRTGIAAFLWANIMSFSLVLYAGYFEQISGSVRRGLPFVLMILATPVVFYCAAPILRLAFRGLWNRAIRMELLLAIGILAAYGYSVVQTFRGEIHLYFDTASAIVTFVLAGKLIERSAKENVSRWITTLHRMMPNKVRLLAHGSERFVSVAALQPGAVFVVKAGERFPADGLVVEGESHADESLLTGESAPVLKTTDQLVVAGSINLDGVLSVQATKSAGDSTLAGIIGLVERALGTRGEIERTVDRVSRVFVPCIVLISFATFLGSWLTAGTSLAHALMRAITVLVIACPCALGLATPLAITAAFGSASQRGILLRDSRVLETLHQIDTAVLDKTGTVTEGDFSLLEFIQFDQSEAELVTTVHANAGAERTSTADRQTPPKGRETRVLSFLAALEQYSEHPLGKAAVKYARERSVPILDAVAIQIRKGRGLTGTVDGRHVFAGNRRLLEEVGIFLPASVEQRACSAEAEGKTVCFFGWGDELRALAIFGDRLKPEAISLVSELKRRGIEIQLVSGDAESTTRWTAESLGIDHCEFEVLPEHKAEVIRRLQERGAVVAMIGDGINDAPALAQADLGIAMLSGADIAMQAASVVLTTRSLRKIIEIFDLSQKTLRIVRQNLFWAFFYNGVGVALAVAGVLNPIMAAGAMLLSSASVVGNSLRLARRPRTLIDHDSGLRLCRPVTGHAI